MIKFNTNTSTTTALLRRLCTAAVSAMEDASSSAGTSATKPASSGAIERLRGQLLSLGPSRGKVAVILHHYFMDGHRIGRAGLVTCMRELRNAKRFHHCLEIFEWMDKGKYTYTDKDHALRIDLICKTKGVEEAEKYFEGLPAEAKNLFTYGPLLNGYCTEKLVDKASPLFEEMEKLSYLTTLAFNNMMTLVLKTGSPEKVPGLVEEMKRKGIPLDSYSHNLLAQSYKLLNDIEGLEKAIEKIEKDGVYCHWTVHSNLAAACISAGDFEKAETALKRLEESSKYLRGKKKNPAHYHSLINLYASTGNLAAVNRVWDSLKSVFQPTTNLSYIQMLQSLKKLGQTDQLQTCFEEWKAGCRRFDLGVVNIVMGSYLGQNRVEEAEQLFDDAVEKSGSPYFSGRYMLISHFLGKREINSALRHLRAVIDVLKEHHRWRPDKEKVSGFWKYFEEEKDVDGAEEFSELLRKVKCLDSTAYISLLGIFAAAGKTSPKIREMMKEDGIKITQDHEILLEKVCPE